MRGLINWWVCLIATAVVAFCLILGFGKPAARGALMSLWYFGNVVGVVATTAACVLGLGLVYSLDSGPDDYE